MKLKTEKITIGIFIGILIVAVFLWWIVFFQTGRDWWRFDVGERIDPPDFQRFLNQVDR